MHRLLQHAKPPHKYRKARQKVEEEGEGGEDTGNATRRKEVRFWTDWIA